ncbi:alanine racemase [Brevinema andersonii]|uniref:Alanine racemase n=1 Tax=Brevinema andersonii TaxID=34097 RepID=A0A1I1EI17_BREAD|nr:alanine racemase [Brevinema andersonii]SFB85048.1 alanine racemase [Brevinema andersonii]
MDFRTSAVINLEYLTHNISTIRKLIGSEAKLCIAVKGNAYGHGLIPIAHACADLNIDMLAVATPHEGRALRESGIQLPILVLTQHTKNEIPDLFRFGLIPLLSHIEYLQEYRLYVQKFQQPLTVHLKIDTGMSRGGFFPEDAVKAFQKIQNTTGINCTGIATHFASGENQTVTACQVELFTQTVNHIKSIAYNPLTIHACNSAGTFYFPQAHYDMVRIGLGAYGYGHNSLRPILSLYAQISQIKRIKRGTSVSYGGTWTASYDTNIATILIGYADGFSRNFSNKGQVQINNKLYPIVGNVCMDQILVNLGDDNYNIGTTVTILDDNQLSADILATKIDSIPHDILTNLSERVQRIYIKKREV